VLAVKRCIEATFTRSHWDELALITSSRELIYGHSRLLRSLDFGDSDYGSCVSEVVQMLIETDPANSEKIADFVELSVWLKGNDPQLFSVLYGHSIHMLDETEKSAMTNCFQVNQHLERIRKAVDSDPELAVGSTKEMLESVLKTVLEHFGEKAGHEDLPELLKCAQKKLKLDPSDVDSGTKGHEIIKRTLSNLGQLVSGINELRNMYGTGHGKTKKTGIQPRHARLVVGAGASLAVFLMETFEWHKQTKKSLE